MKPLLGAYSSQIYAVSRILFGFLFLQHGAQKLFAMLGNEQAVPLFSLLGAAAVIEIVAGGLIALGLYTPWAAFLASGEMAVAFFIQHLPQGFWPITNAGEPAVLYCFIFLIFATRESGIWSIDGLIKG